MVKILFLTANPTDTARLRIDEEIRTIDEKLRQAKYREKFLIEQHHAVRVGDLQRLLLRSRPEIVHFSGHGSPSSDLILEDLSISIRKLGRLLGIFGSNIRCVVLNACYSEHQAHTIAKHIDYVVGMSKAIADQAAIAFSAAFYQALGYGENVRAAFKLGCAQIELENLNEQDAPKLIIQKSDVPDWPRSSSRQAPLKITEIQVIDEEDDVRNFRRMWFGEVDCYRSGTLFR
jgi:hypothetical protein